MRDRSLLRRAVWLLALAAAPAGLLAQTQPFPPGPPHMPPGPPHMPPGPPNQPVHPPHLHPVPPVQPIDASRPPGAPGFDAGRRP